jgi:hypothetical protein
VTVAYADSSALTKLVLDEVESGAARRWFVEADHVMTSVVGGLETRRAVARQILGSDHVESVLKTVDVIALDPVIARIAASLLPPGLRTLDAIHVATALQIGPLDAFVTYDDRLADAARTVGLPVVRPA